MAEEGRRQLYNQKGALLGYTAKQPQGSSGMEITFSFSRSSSSLASSLSSVLGTLACWRLGCCCGALLRPGWREPDGRA